MPDESICKSLCIPCLGFLKNSKSGTCHTCISLSVHPMLFTTSWAVSKWNIAFMNIRLQQGPTQTYSSSAGMRLQECGDEKNRRSTVRNFWPRTFAPSSPHNQILVFTLRLNKNVFTLCLWKCGLKVTDFSLWTVSYASSVLCTCQLEWLAISVSQNANISVIQFAKGYHRAMSRLRFTILETQYCTSVQSGPTRRRLYSCSGGPTSLTVRFKLYPTWI